MAPDLLSLFRAVRRAALESAGSAGDQGSPAEGSSAPALSAFRFEVSIPIELSAFTVRSATALGARRGAITRLTLVLVRVDGS